MKINVKVVPKSSIQRVEENLLGELKVKLKSPPIQGRANQELIEILAKYYKVSKSQIEIIQGEKSKNKIININEYGRKT